MFAKIQNIFSHRSSRINNEEKFSFVRPLTKIKDQSNLKAHIKGESVDINNKFELSEVLIERANSSDENTDQARTTKALIKLRIKQTQEMIQNKLQARLKKAMKTNFSSIKQKELNSRIKHEYWTDSKFNQLIRNFYEFVILAGDRIESREDGNLMIEMCK